MHILNYNSSFLLDNFSFFVSKRLYRTSFKLYIVNIPRALSPGPPVNPVRGPQYPPDSQLHFISQFMQNAEFFSFLANALL